ncbi:MAG: formimidoylglutamate deiminase [Myxococcaceae bacterium]|nr:formimidoylglutamate deiminase [Myxococcaceae bacterium]
MVSVTVYEPDVLVANGVVTPRGRLAVDAAGRVVATPPGAAAIRLEGKALLPGLVNAHSHAFQRVIRGRAEHLARGKSADDFWSWRETMYAAATALDPDGVELASRQAFVEMALAGVTAVGEFHYVHHQSDGTPYSDVHELARRVVKAARDVGLRIRLLRVAYARAGFQVAANPRQRRFLDPDAATALERTASLRRALQGDGLVSVGLAPHSVRAVPREWLEAFGASKEEVVHLHVAEQPAEIAACLTEHGRRPVELLADTGLLKRGTTLVHAIHLEDRERSLVGRSGAGVCACPTTEANLGDGVVAADALLAEGVPLSLGSDSHATIGLLEEARRLEEHLRLVRGRRAVLDPGDGEPHGLSARLFDFASRGGARALGLPGGSLAVGDPADFFTVALPPGLTAPLEAAVFGHAAVRDVAVEGRFLVRDGVHPLAAPTAIAFSQLVSRLQP